MEFKFNLQLFGGGGGGGCGSVESVKTSAPGSTSAATIDNATAGQRQSVRDKLAKAFNRNATNKQVNSVQMTSGDNSVAAQVKKALLGE